MQRLPIGEIRLNEENPRILRDHRFTQLVQSLIDFPEMMALRPTVVDEVGLILGGNMRTRAKSFILELAPDEKTERLEQAVTYRRDRMAPQGDLYNEVAHRKLLAELFDSDKVPVMQALGLSEGQKREFIIKDNHGFGENDWDALANGAWGTVAELEAFGVDFPTKWAEDTADVLPEKELSEPMETEHKCPNCGHEF